MIQADNTMAYNNRGFAKAGLKDHNGAINDYSKAIEIDPDDAIAYNNRRIARGKSIDPEGALEDYSL